MVNGSPVYDRVTKYAHEVASGKVVAGELHRLACERHLNDLKRQRSEDFPFYYDPDKALELLREEEAR